MVCAFRSQRWPEDKVADKAKFGSVEDMYFRLKRWGLSGLVPLKEETEETSRTVCERKARGTSSGPRQPQPSREAGRQLPALSNATALFRATINTLADYIEQLEYHNVVLRDDRFVATDEIPKEAELYPIIYIRDEYSAERWKEICAEHNEDPESTAVVYVYRDASWAKGAAYYPHGLRPV